MWRKRHVASGGYRGHRGAAAIADTGLKLKTAAVMYGSCACTHKEPLNIPVITG